MATGLQSHIGGGAPGRFPRRPQGMDLRMGATGFLMPAFADDLTILDQDTADPGIGGSGKKTLGSQAQGPRHEAVILGVEHGRERNQASRERRGGLGDTGLRGVTSRTAWENSSTSSKLR